MILSLLIGISLALVVGKFFGNYLFYIFIFCAMAIASETALRTSHNVKRNFPRLPTNPQADTYQQKDKKIFSKPPKPHF